MAFVLSLAVAAALIWGGIAWLKPTPREMRQMHAREAAMKQGVSAKLLPCGDFAKSRYGEATLPFYSVQSASPIFRLWRSADQWVAETGDSQSNRLTPKLESWLLEAPENVVGVEGRAKRLGAWWFKEDAEQVASLKAWLADFPEGLAND